MAGNVGLGVSWLAFAASIWKYAYVRWVTWSWVDHGTQSAELSPGLFITLVNEEIFQLGDTTVLAVSLFATSFVNEIESRHLGSRLLPIVSDIVSPQKHPKGQHSVTSSRGLSLKSNWPPSAIFYCS